MTDKHGVGVNGEPDDFAARDDQMLVSRGTGWIVKVVIAAALVMAAVGAVWSLLPLS